jgi:hypothetical protein
MRADAERDSLWKDFSLVAGGGLVNVARAAGVLSTDERRAREQLLRIGACAAVLTWVPLLVLAFVNWTLVGGSSVPFLYSLGTHVRLLVAIPLFFVAEASFDRRVRQVIRLIAQSRLASAQELPRLEDAVRRARWWRDAWITEAALVAITFVFLLNGIRTDVGGGLSTWRMSDGHRTLAGWWYAAISIPLFQFLVWRWCARLLIWWQLLWRISRLDLRLIPTHPDRAGGLGILGVAHLTLAPLTFGASAMLVASYCEQLLFGAATVHQFVVPLAGAIICNTALIVVPLLTFTRRLLQVKEDGLLAYDALAHDYVRAFDDKWMHQERLPSEPLLGSADIQSLADLANSFEVVRTMRAIPIAPVQVLWLVLASMAPALPLVLFVIPLDELILRAVETLLHV